MSDADYELDREEHTIQELLLKFNEISGQLHIVQQELEQAAQRKAQLLARSRRERVGP